MTYNELEKTIDRIITEKLSNLNEFAHFNFDKAPEAEDEEDVSIEAQLGLVEEDDFDLDAWLDSALAD